MTFYLYTNAWTDDWRQFTPNITLLSLIHTHFLFNFPITLLIHLSLPSPTLSNMFGMASIVSLTETIRVISNCPCHKRRNNEHPFLKILWQVGFHCTLFVFPSQSRKQVPFWWTSAYSNHWQTHLHNREPRETRTKTTLCFRNTRQMIFSLVLLFA